MNTFQMIPANRMRVPTDQYQRLQRSSKLAEMAANYDEDALSALDVVGPDSDGMYDILDGGHRWAATVVAWGEHFQLPCMVQPVNTSLVRQAEVYGVINGKRLALKPMELHKANLVARESTAVEVQKIVDESGFTLRTGGGGSALTCISNLRDIYRMSGGDVLESTLAVCAKAWGLDVAPVSNVLGGVSKVIAAHYERVEEDRLAEVLATRSYQQWQLLAREDRLPNGKGGLQLPIANKLIYAYNRGMAGPNNRRRLSEIKRGTSKK